MPLALVGLLAVLFFVQEPLWGLGPMWLKKIWTKIIRFFKGGDKKIWNWSEIESGLYVSSLPCRPEDLKELQRAPHNLGAVVSMVEPWEIKVSGEVLQELGLEWLLLPTPDYSAPRLRDMETAVSFIQGQAKAGRAVLVHCNAGRGRSVVVTIAYLLAKHRADGWDCYSALQAVQTKRQVAPLLACCGTRPQWRAVRSFERHLNCQPHASVNQDADPPVRVHDMTSPTQMPSHVREEGQWSGDRNDVACLYPSPETSIPPVESEPFLCRPHAQLADGPMTQVHVEAFASSSPGRASSLELKPLAPHPAAQADRRTGAVRTPLQMAEEEGERVRKWGGGEERDLPRLVRSPEPAQGPCDPAEQLNGLQPSPAALPPAPVGDDDVLASAPVRASLSQIDIRASAALGLREHERQDENMVLPGETSEGGP